MLLPDLIRELSDARSLVEKLDAEARDELRAALGRLPNEYGFASANEFIEAVKKAARGNHRMHSRQPRKRRSRQRVNPEIQGKIRTMLASGISADGTAALLGVRRSAVRRVQESIRLESSHHRARSDARRQTG